MACLRRTKDSQRSPLTVKNLLMLLPKQHRSLCGPTESPETHSRWPRFTQPVPEAPTRFLEFACLQWRSLHVPNTLPAVTVRPIHRSIYQSCDSNFKIRSESTWQKVWKIIRKIVATIIFLFPIFFSVSVKAVILVPILLYMLLLKHRAVFCRCASDFIFIVCLSKYTTTCIINPLLLNV